MSKGRAKQGCDLYVLHWSIAEICKFCSAAKFAAGVALLSRDLCTCSCADCSTWLRMLQQA